MDILIYDKNSTDNERFVSLIDDTPYELLLDRPSSYEECIDLYSSKKYHCVFIDFTDDIGSKFLSYVQENNPKQKIITLSNTLVCSETKGCEYCKGHYNKIGLVKPLNSEDILYAMSDVSFCQKYVQYGELLNKIKILDSKYESFLFDNYSNTFINKNNYIDDRKKDLESISSDLAEFSIDFEIDNNQNIIVKNLKS